MMVQRELRVIPKGWQHPDHKGLFPAERFPSTPEALAKWCEDYEEPEGPDQASYMPSVAGLAPEQTEIMAYETVSEGGPISPAFPNSPEGRMQLVKWLAENEDIMGQQVDGETWAAILFTDALALSDVHTGAIEIEG